MNDSSKEVSQQAAYPLVGKLFAAFMIGFFVMVALGLWAIYSYQINAPRPEPVLYMQPEP
ncbi:MAG: hypothetical protein P8L18_03760 [Verrucomicrobiota bacterium]|jgi:hypothetical protein|nr:hypothetical protein [Verrucomicrobiota bacterium]